MTIYHRTKKVRYERTKGKPHRTIFPKRKIYRIRFLPPGTVFSSVAFPDSGIHGQLVYANECRARVKLQDRKIQIGDDIEFGQPQFIDICPDTLVHKEMPK